MHPREGEQPKEEGADPLLSFRWSISSVGILFCALVSLSVSGYAIAQGSMVVDLPASKSLVILGMCVVSPPFSSAKS